MTSTNDQLVNNDDLFEHIETNDFPDEINDALVDCERAQNVLLTMRDEFSQSLGRSYVDASLHVNSALQSSIRSIGHGGNLINRLRRILSDEHKTEVAVDLQNMQREMVNTYASCQVADQLLWQNLRQNLRQDPLLHDDPIAIECVDAIEEHANQLQLLTSTSESLLEQSLTINSMRSHMNVLEEHVQRVHPDGPFSRALRLFRKALGSMSHMLQSVIQAFQFRITF